MIQKSRGGGGSHHYSITLDSVIGMLVQSMVAAALKENVCIVSTFLVCKTNYTICIFCHAECTLIS